MNYYEKLVAKMNQSMRRNPKAAMVMDMTNFQIIAKGKSIGSLGKKLHSIPKEISTVVFQKRNQKAAWIL